MLMILIQKVFIFWIYFSQVSQQEVPPHNTAMKSLCLLIHLFYQLHFLFILSNLLTSLVISNNHLYVELNVELKDRYYLFMIPGLILFSFVGG